MIKHTYITRGIPNTCYHVHIIKADKTRTSNSQDIPSRLYVSSLIFNNPWRLGIDAYPIYSIYPNHDNVTYCICLYKGPWLLTFFIWVTFYCPTVAEVTLYFRNHCIDLQREWAATQIFCQMMVSKWHMAMPTIPSNIPIQNMVLRQQPVRPDRLLSPFQFFLLVHLYVKHKLSPINRILYSLQLS